jgi:hypothetical protein
MSNQDFNRGPVTGAYSSDWVNMTVAITRRASGHEKDNARVYSAIAEALEGTQGIEVRLPGVGGRTPAIQVVKSNESLVRITKDEEDELEDKLTEAVPSLLKYMNIEFDEVERVSTAYESFIVAKPSRSGTAKLLQERTGAVSVLRNKLIRPEELERKQRRCPDMTVVYAGARATTRAIDEAEEAIRAQLPFEAGFREAKIVIAAGKRR